MIAITVNGQDCWLLPYAPNTDDGVSLAIKVPVETTRSKTGRTVRTPHGLSLRFAMDWSARLRGAEFAALRNATLTAQDEPVLVPLWPFAGRVGIDTAVMTGGLTIAWTRNWETYAVNPVSLTGYDYYAPALFGYLDVPPRLVSRNDELVHAEFAITEDSPAGYALTPAEGLLAADVTMATEGGQNVPVFPFVPEWSSPPRPGVAVTEVESEAVGPGRRRSRTFYPQLPEQVQQANFKFTTPRDAAKLIAWWLRRTGTADTQWVAGTQKVGFLASNLDADDDELQFTAPIAPLGPIEHVALFDPYGHIEFATVEDSNETSVTLADGLAKAWAAQITTVVPAMLARHTQDSLQLKFRRANESWIATSTLSWREVAAEYDPADGETLGTTLGRVAGAAWFFKIDLDYNGAVKSWYLTNWESGAVVSSTTWTYNACDFDQIVSSIDLEDDTCMFSARWFDDGPWENWRPGNLAAVGYLTIYRADVNSAGAFSNLRQVWKGELQEPTIDGASVSQRAIGANALFGRDVPRQLMAPPCGTNLFKPRCGLALVDWIFEATIAAVDGNEVTVTSISRANDAALPAGFGAADWFALGWMEWSVAGAPLRNGILTSEAIDSGAIVLTLERPCTLAVSTAVTIVPGCDRRGVTCREKFDNYANFRGFEFMPSTSPSLIVPQQRTSNSKK